jgi:hypothetical protein
MDRRELLLAGAAASLPGLARTAPAALTRWAVTGSEGFDALCFLGPLSGKDFYARFYPKELAAFRPAFPADAAEALASLRKDADAAGFLLGPALCLLFSGGPVATLGDLIAALDAADTVLKPPYRASAYWDAMQWAGFQMSGPRLRRVLEGLAKADFPTLRRQFLADRLAGRTTALQAKLAGVDMIGEQQRLVGRRLDPQIEVVLLWFSMPHGIRVQGQRFLTHVNYPDQIVLRNAAHEIFHPPFPKDGAAARAAQAALAKDPLIARILAEHDHSFGYNSLDGLLDEDTVQALEQIVSERLGFARTPAERWSADGGMHVLAAGLYGLLKADGFDRTGGNIETWMLRAANGGRLAPASLHPAAAKVLGVDPDHLWPRTPPKA